MEKSEWKRTFCQSLISPIQTFLLLSLCLPLAPWQDKDIHCFQGWLKQSHKYHLFSGGNAAFFFDLITWHVGS